MRSDIEPGGVFPDYDLPDHSKTMRRLSELQREAWEAGDRTPFHGWNRWSPERIAAERVRVAS